MGLSEKDRIRAKLKAGDTTVRVLLSHPMHTGRAKNDADKLIPAEFIQDIRCWRNSEEVLSIKCGTATARNPYFSFHLVGGQQGDQIAIRWVDNLGAKGTVETTVI
ncbi:MAG: thiosulfate oxidation carrier complex protein SoxZ [Gammaproteobacteria bacterium]|nr:thiosulfate oxidation carrier complex protein SoxZ [Gammaproteobacteria bacterium]MDH5591600.1 thiosulfate oxidation carrier complex protein SoxZ [Gammaproteobacteria bacterium]